MCVTYLSSRGVSAVAPGSHLISCLHKPRSLSPFATFRVATTTSSDCAQADATSTLKSEIQIHTLAAPQTLPLYGSKISSSKLSPESHFASTTVTRSSLTPHMFSFSFFSRKRASSIQAPDAEPTKLTPENRVISINHTDDGFVDVDLKKLSYAEVAALSRSVKETTTKDSNITSDAVDTKEIGVIEASELGTDVSDCQMASTLKRKTGAMPSAITIGQKLAGTADLEMVAAALEDEELVLDTMYDDKGNRFSGKQYRKKLMKKKTRRMAL